MVFFRDEEAIDAGGVKKEYFQLLFKELFDPNFGMFTYNEDSRLYYFDGKTFESTVNFELIGILLGMAPANNCLIDIPLCMACYKVLLGEKPDLEDLRQWQPNVAKSLDYILSYEDETPLEDILMRYFVIDLDRLDVKETVELKPGGAEILVTKDNKSEFVHLYIQHLFEVQCAP